MYSAVGERMENKHMSTNNQDMDRDIMEILVGI
jgi:hypothetical protein